MWKIGNFVIFPQLTRAAGESQNRKLVLSTQQFFTNPNCGPENVEEDNDMIVVILFGGNSMISRSRLVSFMQSLGLFTQSILSGMWILIEVGAKYYHNLMMMMNDTVGRLSIWRWPIPFFSRPPPDWCIVIIKDGQFHLQDHSVHWIREFSEKTDSPMLVTVSFLVSFKCILSFPENPFFFQETFKLQLSFDWDKGEGNI